MIIIREADMADIETIRAIESASASRFLAIGMAEIAADEPTDAAALASRVAARRLVVACADGGTIVAFVMFRAVERDAYVEQLDVLPAWAGRRIGARLIDAVAARARADGRDGLLLSTFADVPWNAPYYARLGFEVLPQASLSPALLAIRAEHEARGLDETRRVFMRRPIAA